MTTHQEILAQFPSPDPLYIRALLALLVYYRDTDAHDARYKQVETKYGPQFASLQDRAASARFAKGEWKSVMRAFEGIDSAIVSRAKQAARDIPSARRDELIAELSRGKS